MSWLHTLVLAFIQGLTEFLPISSSAHLLLPKILLGWQDQGLALDVALHVGTLGAVVMYLRYDLGRLASGCWCYLRGEGSNECCRAAGLLVLATVPLVPAGLLVAPHIEVFRTAHVIMLTTVLFGLLLWWADRSAGARQLTQLRWHHALLIGIAQTLALVPGTSRSGITMTAGLALGLTRVDAARFSFLLSIPAILASGADQFFELKNGNAPVDWFQLFAAALAAGLVALLSMHLLLAWLQRATMLPFVIYRLVLGAVLLLLIL